jgi:serine/threonine-protein kinase
MGTAADDERLERAEGRLVVGAERSSVEPASATGDTATRREPHAVADPLQVVRAATGLSVMCVAWAATIPADLAYAALLGLDGTRSILATRGVATLVFAGMWLRFRITTAMSMRELRVHRHALVDVGMLALGLEASMLGGLGSDVAVGAIVIGASLGVFPRRWRDHLPMAIVAAAIYPLTVLGVALLGGPGAATLNDPLAVFRFALHASMIAVAAALGVVMSHLGWSLRRGSFANKRVGRYELRRLLGRGGMGEVWAAHHAGLRREVALKMLDARIDDAVARERFEREVRATAELAHPHTVRLFDYGTTSDGVLFYAMELLEGEHLAALVRREGPLSPERAAYLVDQAARALGEAHDKRIVHRDVKPENLFVCEAAGEGDFVKVLDFGIARDLAETGTALTHTGSVAGSAVTIAPEVVRGDPASAAADVYALGVVLYFVLTGVFPFERDQRAATLLAHVSEPVVPPSLRASQPIPRELEAIVLRCLAKDPRTRFASGRVLAQALADTGLPARHRPGPARTARGSAPPPEPDRDDRVTAADGRARRTSGTRPAVRDSG